MQRAVAAAAAAASVALICAASLSGSARGGPTALWERQLDMEIHHRSPDMGEDYWSAIEAPHKHYEYPWHFDQTFKHAAAVQAWGPEKGWNDGHVFKRETFRRNLIVSFFRQYDEYGDSAYDPDMYYEQLNDCYDDITRFDCYRENFDERTGYMVPSPEYYPELFEGQVENEA